MSPCPPPALGQTLQTRPGECPDPTSCSCLSCPVPLTLWETSEHTWVSGRPMCGWWEDKDCQDVSASQVTWLSPCNPNQNPRRSVWNWTKQSSCTFGRRNRRTQPAMLSRSITSRSTCCNKSTYLMPIRGWWALFWALDIGYSVESSLQPYELGIMFNLQHCWYLLEFLDLQSAILCYCHPHFAKKKTKVQRGLCTVPRSHC